MTIMDREDFPGWDAYYKENELETMPWFCAELDHDVGEAVQGIDGGDFLDLGSGPGTQAIELARLGFNATGSDISEAAMTKAAKLGEANFVVDDILDSKLPENGFDYIQDRGCFHVFDSEEHQNYLKNVKKILKDGGILFLKCMSKKETNLAQDQGPHKYEESEIREIFSGDFEIQTAKHTVYYCTIDPLPKAIFFIMRKK